MQRFYEANYNLPDGCRVGDESPAFYCEACGEDLHGEALEHNRHFYHPACAPLPPDGGDNDDEYCHIAGICFHRCIMCGQEKFLRIDRLDIAAPFAGDFANWKQHLRGGLGRRQTVCICLDCALAMRVGFWDRRYLDRCLDVAHVEKIEMPSMKTLIKLADLKEHHKAAMQLIRKAGMNRHENLHQYQRALLLCALGQKCAECGEHLDLKKFHFDCRVSQLIDHAHSLVNSRTRTRFYVKMLLDYNLQTLHHKCHRAKSNRETRYLGIMRRLIFGRYLLVWRDAAPPEFRAALQGRILNEPIVSPRMPPPEQVMRCSVTGCNHLSEFMHLYADHMTQRLIIMCDRCKHPEMLPYEYIATIVELDGFAGVQRASHGCTLDKLKCNCLVLP